MFKLPTELANHLEQEIHTKLVKAVEDQAKGYNKMWAEREEKGKKFHTTYELKRGRMVERPRVWREEANAGYIFIQFAMTETKYDYETSVTDYLRPMSCTVDYQGVERNAKFQAKHSIGLFESRVNGHLSTTDKITELNLRLGNKNLIHGFVKGITKDAEEFKITTQMIWNYRYGHNSANGYLTQYVQFRSDRTGARQEGKTVLQRATEAEIQAKKDAKQAELVALSSILRKRIIETSSICKIPHLGSCLSCIDLLIYLYWVELSIDPKNSTCENRDRFLLSKGHGAPALFQVLAESANL